MLVAALVSAGVAGCAQLRPHADTARYYVLTARTAEGPEPTPTPPGPSLGVARISIPAYLERDAIVTRTAESELHISSSELWAEPLRDGFTRILLGELARQLGPGRVIAAPWDASHPPALTLDVDVRRFERLDGGSVELDAVWTLSEGRSGATVMTRHSNRRQPVAPVAGDSTDAAVSALSLAVVDLGREIASAARQAPATVRPATKSR